MSSDEEFAFSEEDEEGSIMTTAAAVEHYESLVSVIWGIWAIRESHI